MTERKRPVVVGGGFTGLVAAHELAKQGRAPLLLEADKDLGGLAQSFSLHGVQLEKFYHHWFTGDTHALDLVRELGLGPKIVERATRTGIMVKGGLHRLSTPLDLLRFTPLSLPDRIRLGLLMPRAKLIKDWKALESITARDWLIGMCGQRVYDTVWAPLLKGKFGPYADEIAAVWIWNKIELRGGSRGKRGEERLLTLEGGFATLVERLAQAITEKGGRIETNCPVRVVRTTGAGPDSPGRVTGVETDQGFVPADKVLLTTPLPVAANLLEDACQAWGDKGREYLASLRRIRYLGNICLVLVMDRPLSDHYWINVADPDFPFVGIIEHTNFVSPDNFDGKHIVYLTKYLPEDDPLYSMDERELLEYSLPFLKRLFPDFTPRQVLGQKLFRARYSQHVVEKDYSIIIPSQGTPIHGLYLCSMAQIHPQDRGTNHAVQEGMRVVNETML